MAPHLTTHGLFPIVHGRSRTGAAFQFVIEHYLLLPAGAVIALLWANAEPESYFTVAHRLAFVVNEIGMALFVGFAAQEVFEAGRPDGPLHTWRRWVLPVVAAAGGLAGSTLVYLGYLQWRHEIVWAQGWPVAGAIDLGLAYLVVRGIFGRHPVLPFALLVAIAAGAFGLTAMAVVYPAAEVRPGGALLMAAAIGLAAVLRHHKVRAFWPYLLVCGAASWWGLYLDGFHPALALVPIVPFLPHTRRSVEHFLETPDDARASPRHGEHLWNYWVQGVLFLFALVNAGVLVRHYGTGTWALTAAALIGRPVGILAATALAVALGFHLPARLRWRDMVVMAIAVSPGFTFALFFATGVFAPGPLLAQARLGALLSVVAVVMAFGTARLLGVGRFARHTPAPGHVGKMP